MADSTNPSRASTMGRRGVCLRGSHGPRWVFVVGARPALSLAHGERHGRGDTARHRKRGVSTEERCYITELSNSERDPHASIAGRAFRSHHHALAPAPRNRGALRDPAGAGRVEVERLGRTSRSGRRRADPALCRQRIACLGDEDLVFLAMCTPRFRQEAYEDVDDAA